MCILLQMPEVLKQGYIILRYKGVRMKTANSDCSLLSHISDGYPRRQPILMHE